MLPTHDTQCYSSSTTDSTDRDWSIGGQAKLSKYCDTDIRILDLSQTIEQKILPPGLQSASDPILWDYNHGRPSVGISFCLF